MKRMTKGRGDHLREFRTLCAERIGGSSRIDLQSRMGDMGNMTELMDDGALLRYDQQQPESCCLEQVCHSNSIIIHSQRVDNATRILGCLHDL